LLQPRRRRCAGRSAAGHRRHRDEQARSRARQGRRVDRREDAGTRRDRRSLRAPPPAPHQLPETKSKTPTVVARTLWLTAATPTYTVGAIAMVSVPTSDQVTPSAD